MNYFCFAAKHTVLNAAEGTNNKEINHQTSIIDNQRSNRAMQQKNTHTISHKINFKLKQA